MYRRGMPFSLLDRLHHLVLPVGMLAVANAATYTRYTRASMLEVIGQDYIRTARAKGTPEPLVIWKHGLKNAATPVVTILALDLPALFAGAVFTETMNSAGRSRARIVTTGVAAFFNPCFQITRGRSE